MRTSALEGDRGLSSDIFEEDENADRSGRHVAPLNR